jgi:hypothetical protein
LCKFAKMTMTNSVKEETTSSSRNKGRIQFHSNNDHNDGWAPVCNTTYPSRNGSLSVRAGSFFPDGEQRACSGRDTYPLWIS